MPYSMLGRFVQNFCAPDVGNTPKKVVAVNALVHAVCAGEPEGGAAPKLGVDDGLGHVATLATLPAAQAEGQPHAVGATAFAGQKEPAGQGAVVMVYEMPLATTLTSL